MACSHRSGGRRKGGGKRMYCVRERGYPLYFNNRNSFCTTYIRMNHPHSNLMWYHCQLTSEQNLLGKTEDLCRVTRGVDSLVPLPPPPLPHTLHQQLPERVLHLVCKPTQPHLQPERELQLDHLGTFVHVHVFPCTCTKYVYFSFLTTCSEF